MHRRIAVGIGLGIAFGFVPAVSVGRFLHRIAERWMSGCTDPKVIRPISTTNPIPGPDWGQLAAIGRTGLAV